METIKNILHPGKAKDDETLYGTGQSTGNTGAGTGHGSGEGTHFSGAKETTSSNPLTGTHSSANTSALSGTTSTGHATHEPFSGEGKHLESSSTNPTATSGLTGPQAFGVGEGNLSAGQSHLGRDAALGAGAGGLAEHEYQKHKTTSGLGSNTATSGLGNTQTSGLTSGTTTTNPYSSNTSTQRSVPGEWVEDHQNVGASTMPGSNTSSGHQVGSDAAALSTAGALGAGAHHHNQGQRDLPIRGNEPSQGSTFTNEPQGNQGYLSNTTGASSSTFTNQPQANQGYPSNTTGTSGIGASATQGSAYPAQNTASATQGSGSHHLGRDAAIGGAGLAGAGLAAHEHNKHNEREFPLSSNTGPTNTSTGYAGPGVSSGTSHHTGPSGSALGSHGPHSTDTANLLDPNVNARGAPTEDAHRHTESGGGAEAADKHHSRDAGVGAGASLGAAALAKHEYDKHQQTSSSGTHAGLGQSSITGQTPHQEARTVGIQQAGFGQSSSYPTTSTINPPTSTEHHTGRNAGLGAGAVGAAGLAAHEHNKHDSTSTGHISSTTPAQTTSTTSALPGPAPNTAGPHKQDWLNKLDPRVTANPDTANTSKDHHSRDAAVAGGVGGAAAAYGAEHSKHQKSETEQYHAARKEHQRDLMDDKSQSHVVDTHGAFGQPKIATSHSTSTTGTHSTNDPLKDYHYGNKPGPVEGVGASTTGSHLTDTNKEHHHGRDAALVGGAGAVGAGAYEANKHHNQGKDAKELEKEQKHAEKEAKKEHKHEEKEAKKEHHHEHKEEHKEKKSGGFLSFLHRDKNKKYTKEEEDEFDRQEKEHHSRNAGLGAGAVSASGAAAYEADKHHKSHETSHITDADKNKSLPIAPGNQGVGTGAGTHNALSDNSTSQHHTGRDAALGTVAAGAAAHEHEKRSHEHDGHGHNAIPLDEKPKGTDLGDKLHGVDRNRGVQGASGLPGTSGFGTGTHSESTTDRDGHPIGTASSTGSGHHLGRDAAVGGAGAGLAGGLAAHEHNKHSHTTEHQGSNYPTSSTHQTSTSGSALPGAAGLVSHGQDHHRHDSGYDQGKTTSTTPSTTGIYEGKTASHAPSSGLATSQSTSTTGGEYDPYSTAKQPSVFGSGDHSASSDLGSKVSDASGRNRLHKDPPADHPAAQSGLGEGQGMAHVPASGAETEKLVKQGEQRLGGDTGVHNASKTEY